MAKAKVAVIFGSRSAEHDVSIITAIASIIRPLEADAKYEVIPIYIDKLGRWFSHPRLKDIKLFTSGDLSSFLRKLKPLKLQLNGGFSISGGGIKPKFIKIDIVFPAMHGTHGEDGELMGLLELANVAYVGCDLPSSVLAMDKALAKIMAANANIATSKFQWFYADEFKVDPKKVIASLKDLAYPLFIKPVHLGSSIAIARVKNEQELINAIEVAAHYDNKIIVEEAVNNLIEVTLPIIGNSKLEPALLEEPLIKGEDFFDFELKYMQGGKKGKGKSKQGAQGYSQIPANLESELYKKAEQAALNVYRALGCKGIARVDLLIDSKTKQIYFNEVNPLPGSLYAHNWQKAGKSAVNLVNQLIDLALEEHQKKQALATVFETNYLKQY